jgi:hypothetical protein
MARKVIGPTGSRRRRWLFLFCLIAAFGTAAFVIAGAGAATGSDLYNAGMFELDGNTLVNSPPNSTPGTACANPWPASANTGGDDWAGLYQNRSTAGANGGPCSSNAFTFVPDGVGSADKTYWSGGGSKDAYDPALGPWQWGANDVSPDKNDLDNAFAAIYTKPNTTTQDLYFGSDRYTTNGDAQQGFQFLQNAVCLAGAAPGSLPGNAACPSTTPTTFPNTCSPSVSGSNAGYFVNPSTGCPAHHRTGDLLILVNFNNGGTLGLAGVFEWHCNQVNNVDACQTGGSYTQVIFGSGADCRTLNAGQSFCSTSNTGSLANEPVWAYTAKGTSGQATYSASAFVEGGVDLSRIPGAGTCFPTFMAESRSSAGPSSGLSLQAQLKDLVFGRFQLCGANVTTSASADGTTVTPKTPVYDTATVTGTGTSSPPTPTGSVEFYLCGPSASSNPTCAATTDGTDIGAGTLSGSGATATATSPSVNCTADGSGCTTGLNENPLQNGYYCFLAVYGGDPNYSGPLSNPNENHECFRVLKINTTVTTHPQESSSNITAATFGDHVTDHAQVDAVSTGDGDVTGQVTFYICDPTVLAANSESSCVTGGSQVGTAVDLNPTSGASPPSSTADSSTYVTANKLGTWCFRAVYTPATGSSYNGQEDHSTGECFTVSDTTTASSAQTWYPNDSASVSADHGAPISGTLTIQLYADADCGATTGESGDAVSGQSYTSGALSNQTSISVNSGKQTSYGVSANASVSWLVTFTSSNTSLLGSSSHCETSSVTINNNP